MIYKITCRHDQRKVSPREHDHAHNGYEDAECKNALVSPPHLPAYLPGAASECGRLSGHIIRLIDQELDPLAARQDLLDILHHDVLDLRELRLCTLQLIRGWRGVELVHKLRDGWTEGALERIWWVRCALLR